MRELDHVIERAVLMSQGPQIKANDLGLTTWRDGSPRLEEMSLEEVEAFLIKKALARHDGNARKAAEALGLEPERVLSAPPAIWALDVRIVELRVRLSRACQMNASEQQAPATSASPREPADLADPARRRLPR